MDLPFKPSTFFWGMTAIYIVLGIGTLAYFAFRDGVAAALGSIWAVVFFCCQLAAAALICGKLEGRTSR